LVGQIFEAGVAAAVARPSGRLQVPLVAVLDEAANICPLPDLPDQFSWLGKHAVVPLVFVQSPAQGEQAWGQAGFKAMTSQAVHIYGGNVDDKTYLEHWVALAGPADVAHVTESHGRGERSRSTSWAREPILTVADLGAMPKDRALVRFPENEPVLIRKRWWYHSDHAAIVHTSRRASGMPVDDTHRPGLTARARTALARRRHDSAPVDIGQQREDPTRTGGAKGAQEL
ncbi:MAG TPA: TraM recognition domain-containing protein, partial [Mycobacterium sp.]